MSLSGPLQKQATAGGADASAIEWLPQDVLANILLRLPASDLRRSRRVCKEWREIISNPAFMDDHMLHGPRTLTHTLAFFPGQPYSTKYSDKGGGFLLDDQWRIAATFSAPWFDELIGQCNGLLCFLDGCYRSRALHVVEPFSGESLTLPLAPRTELWREHAAYCFGFDASTRRYKIFHQGQRYNVEKQDLYVYTIGGGENEWRRVQVAGEKVRGVFHGDPVFSNGSMYWSVVTTGHLARLARFDLATEEVTSEPIDLPTKEITSESIGFLQDQVGTSLAVMTEAVTLLRHIAVLQHMVGTSLAVVTDSDARVRVMTMTLPHGRRLARPDPLQRGQLLLDDYLDGGLYAHTVAPASNDLGCGELLLETSKAKRPARCATRGLFVPIHVNRKPTVDIVRRTGYRDDHHARVFCYAPPVSPAPLEHYFGKLRRSAHAFEGRNQSLFSI